MPEEQESKEMGSWWLVTGVLAFQAGPRCTWALTYQTGILECGLGTPRPADLTWC